MPDVIEFIKFLCDKAGSKKIKIIILVIIVMIIICKFFQSEFYADSFKEPYWYMETDEEKLEKKIYSDIALKGGKVVVRPQLEVVYRGKIIFLINIKGLFKTNEATLTQNDNDLKNIFILQLLEKQLQRMQLFQREFNEFLNEKVQLENQNIGRLETRIVYLINLEYQNKRSTKTKRKKIICTDSSSNNLIAGELKYRESNVWLDLNTYNTEQSLYANIEVVKVVNCCIDEISNEIIQEEER